WTLDSCSRMALCPGSDKPFATESLQPEQLRRGRPDTRAGSRARPGRRVVWVPPLAGPRIRVRVRAHFAHVAEGELVEVGPLRQDLPQLHVVLLTGFLLGGFDRVTVEHAGAARSVEPRFDFDEVQEFQAPVPR